MNSNSAEWAQVEPLLDEAMEALEETDRSAILLRYFENKSLRDVGQTLGTSEDAAQKRVSRAVERLREFFAQRGVTVGASGLVIVITANAVQAAPAGLAATISTAAALTGTAFQTTTAIAATKTIVMTTLPKTLVAVVIAASLSMPVLVQYRDQARLREIKEVSLQRAERLAELRAENEGFSNLLAQAKTAQPPMNEQFNEVLRLRGEVGRLQAAVQELTGPKTNEPLSREEVLDSMRRLYLNRVNRLKQFFAANPAEAVPELQYLTDKDWLELVTYDHHRLDPDGRYALSSARSKAQISFAKSVLDAALRQYGRNNNGQFPTDLSQLVPYFKSSVDPSVLEHWAILPASSLPSTMRVDELWVITQRAPVDAARDERIVIGMKNSQLGRRSTNDWFRTE